MSLRVTSGSEWMSCPECGSENIRTVKETDADRAICNDCGHEGWLV